jgi:hypothetical protein
VSTYPKFEPIKVTEEPPVSGRFPSTSEVSGASKLRRCRLVPMKLLIVTLVTLEGSLTGAELSHLNAVVVCHEVHAQGAEKICTEMLDATVPKCRPERLTRAPPVCGTLRTPCDITGASILNTPTPVPNSPPTLIIIPTLPAYK